jgi:hypothetical protein
MQITRDIETQQGPAEWFTGDVYIAMQQNDESGSPVTWGEHVTDGEYRGAT